MLPTRNKTLPTLAGALAAVVLVTWCLQVSAPSASGRQMVGNQGRIDCFDGRVPIKGLPFTIDQCGSYFLTDCLTGQAGQNGITIDADDVTLDLNGFTLSGVPGSLDGIHVPPAGNHSNIFIFDGTIKGLATFLAYSLNPGFLPNYP